MPEYQIAAGDRVEVARHHRWAGARGEVVALGDNIHSAFPNQNAHILFDRPVLGICAHRQAWMGLNDLLLVEKGPKNYCPPPDIIQSAPEDEDR